MYCFVFNSESPWKQLVTAVYGTTFIPNNYYYFHTPLVYSHTHNTHETAFYW